MKEVYYMEANATIAFPSILTTVYVYKTQITQAGVKRYWLKDIFHKDIGIYTDYMRGSLLVRWDELRASKIQDYRVGFPVSPYFYPFIHADKLNHPEEYI